MPPEIDPTQQGGQEEVKPTANPRNAAMAQIAQAAHNSVKDELSGFNEDTGEVDAAPTQTAEATQPAEALADEPKAEDAAPAAEPEAKPAPRMLTIIVDGQPIEVEESRILEAGKRTLQKDHAADRRLQEATQTKRQAEMLLEQAKRLSAPDAASPEKTPSQDASHQPASQQSFDPVAIDTYVENKLYMRDAQKAAEKFWNDFPEIASDPYLKGMAIDLENKRLSTAAALGEGYGDPAKAYQSHGEAIKKWLAERTGQTAPVQSMTDRKEAKRTITAVSAVNAKAPAPAAPKVLTQSELIEKMRADRSKGRPVQIQRLQ